MNIKNGIQRLSVVTLVSLSVGYSDSASTLQHFSELKLHDLFKTIIGDNSVGCVVTCGLEGVLSTRPVLSAST